MLVKTMAMIPAIANFFIGCSMENCGKAQPARCRRYRLFQRNYINFYQYIFGKARDLNRGTSRRGGAEVLAVDLVHRREFRHVLQEYGRANDLSQRSEEHTS